MEKFARYGINLKPLEESDIEMVRQWRNDPKIASLMLDQTFITPEMQSAWFKKLQMSDTNFYFLAFFKDKPIGVASLTSIDPIKKQCEPGMYIYDDEYRNNIVPFCVAFALNDLAFERFELTKLLGKIFSDNQASVRFHLACGYQKYNEQENGLGLYSLNQTDYQLARDKLARFIRY